MKKRKQSIRIANRLSVMMITLFTAVVLCASGAMADLPGKGKKVKPCYNGIAEELLKKNFTKDDDTRLIDEYMQKVGELH